MYMSSRDEFFPGGLYMCNFNYNCNNIWQLLCSLFGWGC